MTRRLCKRTCAFRSRWRRISTQHRTGRCAHHVVPEALQPERIERADRAWDAVVEGWKRAAAQTPARRSMEATELAAAFRRALEAHPELIGMALPSDAIENAYPTFCGALGLAWAPPFKREMPRKRHFHERDEHGKRRRGGTPCSIRRSGAERPERGQPSNAELMPVRAPSASRRRRLWMKPKKI